jgi:gentisate 1,2-dioxygenase
MLPDGQADGRARRGLTSPIFNYPYARSRDALEKMRRSAEWDVCHGLKMRYVNPETGDHAMPTLGTFLQLLPKGFKTSRYRATDATVFSVVEPFRSAKLAPGHARGHLGRGPIQLF